MALINNRMNKMEKERNSVHKEVNCTYTTFVDNKGEKFFQIDTYGSEDRKIQDKISQSIQFNMESAKKLVELLVQEFNIELKK